MQNFYQNHKNRIIWVGSVVITALVVLFVFGKVNGDPKPYGEEVFGLANIAVSSDSAVSGFATESLGVRSKISPILPPTPGLPSVQAGDVSDKKVVRNGSLSLVVNKIEKAIEQIKGIVEGSGGFVQNSSVYDTGNNKKGGNITVRVPEKSFDESVATIKTFAIKVSREDVNTRDVTEQFVDMEVRIKNMKAEEAQYVSIMKRAVKIEDVLNVSQRLANVRTRIEQTEGQLNYLSRQVDMSTISISLVAEADVEVFGVVWSPLAELKQGVRNMLQDIVDFINEIVAFVFKLPALLLWIGLIALIVKYGWRVLKVIKRRHFSNEQNNIKRR